MNPCGNRLGTRGFELTVVTRRIQILRANWSVGIVTASQKNVATVVDWRIDVDNATSPDFPTMERSLLFSTGTPSPLIRVQNL
jgi:hypothetical protein